MKMNDILTYNDHPAEKEEVCQEQSKDGDSQYAFHRPLITKEGTFIWGTLNQLQDDPDYFVQDRSSWKWHQ